MKRLVVLFWLVLFLPASAEANTTVLAPPGSGFPYQQWVDEAAIPAPDLSVSIVEGNSEAEDWPCRASYRPKPPMACALPDQRTIYVDPRVSEPRLTLYHELGHIADAAMFDSAERQWFAEFVGVPAVPWLSEASHDTAGEDFASVYAVCLRFGLHVRFTQMELEDGRYIYPKRHLQLCGWISRVT